MEKPTKLTIQEQNLELMKSLAEQNPNLISGTDSKGRKYCFNFYTKIEKMPTETPADSKPHVVWGDTKMIAISKFGSLVMEAPNACEFGNMNGHKNISRMYGEINIMSTDDTNRMIELITDMVDTSEENYKSGIAIRQYDKKAEEEFVIKNTLISSITYSAQLPDSNDPVLKDIASIKYNHFVYGQEIQVRPTHPEVKK